MRRNAVSANLAICVAAAVALSLVVAMLQLIGASSATAGPLAPAMVEQGRVLERPDGVSAMVSAQALGVRVEDVSQRTEASQVFANPDGTWTSESATEPVRVRDGQGAWRDIDTALVERAGGLAPAYASTDVVFSAGGDRTFARVTADNGDPVGWRWPEVLPVPVVEGDTATYRNVVAGGDLVVTAHATGFSHSVVLRERPTVPVEFAMPVSLGDGELLERPNGSLAVESGSGEVLVSAPGPLMWDSSTDAGGESENVAPVDASVRESAAGATTLTLSPDARFLADPDTVYPVVVDPSFTTFTTGDTWIQNADYTTSQVGSDELRAGSYDGGGRVARSFMDFNDQEWVGKHVTNATLRLKNFYSGSCTGSAIRAARINTAWSGSTLTWGNQPGAGTLLYDDYGPAHGYSASCASQDAVWDVGDIVDSWAQGRAENHGIRLRAVDEGSIFSWRKYRSGNYDNGDNARPKLVVTYNSFPNTAGGRVRWSVEVVPVVNWSDGRDHCE